MLTTFIESIYQFEFLRMALLASILIGISTGILGSIIVLRGMSLLGDAISHAILPGIAISYLIGWNYFIGALLAGIIATLLMSYINHHSVLKSDTSIGIILSAFLSLGIILISLTQTTSQLNSLLFGNILSISQTDLYLIIAVTVIVIIIVSIKFQGILISSFDPILARVLGFRVNAYHYLIMVLLSLVSVIGLQSVGSILVVALLITPAATAQLFAKSLKSMMVMASIISSLSSIVGMMLAFEYNIPVGSCIVLVLTFVFIIAFVIHNLIKKGR